MNQKIPPHSLEAEAAVLGAVLTSDEAIMRIGDKVSPEDFYAQRHGLIYAEALRLSGVNMPVDVLTVSEGLKSRGELAQVGGAAYVSELIDNALSSANVEYHARIVSERALVRRLIAAATRAAAEGYELAGDVHEFVARCEQEIYRVSQEATQRQGTVLLGDTVKQWFEELDELRARDGALYGLASGFTALDHLLCGMTPGNLIVVAARPSIGKTTFGTSIAENVADRGIGVAIFSFEMTKEELRSRIIAARSRVDHNSIRIGKIKAEDMPEMTRAARWLQEAPIYVNDSAKLTPLEIRSEARRLKATSAANLGLVIVDYLQLIRPTDASVHREQQVSEISLSLKHMAKELGLPVLALSQLNRKVEERHPPIPRFSDLRESGAIENDADVVIFLYREDYYDKGSKRKGEADIIVAKQRNGPVGEIRLAFRPEYTRFDNLAYQQDLH